MPDITVTHSLVNELLLSHVEERHIHVIAKEGTPMEELPEASLLQKSDFVPAIERGLALGAITGVMVGLVAMTLPPAGLVIGGGAVTAIGAAGSGVGGWLSSMVGVSVPSTRLKKFEDAVKAGEFLVLVDIKRDRVNEIEELVKKHLLDANPYQLSIRSLPSRFRELRCWSKSDDGLSSKMSKRLRDLADQLGTNLQIAEGLSEGPLSFSRAAPHGVLNSNMGTLMMTRIEMDNKVFVHASDIQLLDDSTVDRVINWQPDIVLAAGPPLYLDRLSKVERECARRNALRLASNIDVVILDHHLMRSVEGEVWLDELSAAVGKKVYCAADFMGRPRRLLEAQRPTLYKKMPVPDGWHDDYAKGMVDTGEYLNAIHYQDAHGVNTSHYNDGDGH